MTYLQKNMPTIILALAIAFIFTLIDLYLIDVSAYLLAGLLAVNIIHWWKNRKKKPVKQEIKLKTGGESMKCVSPCNGKLKHIATKKPGGIEQWRCTCCKRKYEVVGGKLKQVAV